LSAWDLGVRRVDWTSLSSGMPGAAREARQVADAFKVDAVVWISETGRDHALWIFDAATGQTVARPLSVSTPVETADAAAVALTVKTLLRATLAAPPAERLGAGTEPPIGAAGIIRLEAEGGSRFFSSDAAVPEARFGLSALWFPRPLGYRLGADVGVSIGPGVAVQSGDFSGHFLDLSVSPALRGRVPLGAGFALEPGAGMTLHVTHLDGAAALRGVNVSTSRLDSSADASLLCTYAVAGGVTLGLRVSGSYLLRYQRYLVDGAPILTLAPIQASGGLVLGARLN
jgi:hypothetical protein